MRIITLTDKKKKRNKKQQQKKNKLPGRTPCIRALRMLAWNYSSRMNSSLRILTSEGKLSFCQSIGISIIDFYLFFNSFFQPFFRAITFSSLFFFVFRSIVHASVQLSILTHLTIYLFSFSTIFPRAARLLIARILSSSQRLYNYMITCLGLLRARSTLWNWCTENCDCLTIRIPKVPSLGNP